MRQNALQSYSLILEAENLRLADGVKVGWCAIKKYVFTFINVNIYQNEKFIVRHIHICACCIITVVHRGQLHDKQQRHAGVFDRHAQFRHRITGETTATHRFLVYNRHKKQLRISDISIDGVGDGAHFYMNVDGRSGERFSDIEVRGNDSLYVFVTARVDETSADTPFDVYGNLNFVTNGVLQTVTLRAAGQNAVTVSDWTIRENTALTADRPYRVMDSLVVDEGATLRIPAGTTVYFHDKAKIRVKGTLLMEGTQGNPVRLRADRLDKVAGSIPFQLMSGQWDGVHYDKDSYGNEMAYVEMQGSSSGVVVDSCGVLDKRKLHIFNSVLHNSSSSVLTAPTHGLREGSEFSDASEGVVNLTGGKYAFNNCTFANYYLFSAITSPLLTLNYVLPKDKSYDNPLMDAEFNNCVVYGNASDISEGDLKGSAVYLRNCLLRSKGNDDDNFINCVWGGDPKFYTVRKDYISTIV